MAEKVPQVPPKRRSIGPVVSESLTMFGDFLRAQALISLILTAFHLVCFYLAEIPLWWVSGLFVGALTLIPYLGFLVGAIAGSLLTVAAGGDHWMVVRLLAVMALGQALEGFYLTPKILGQGLKMHPVLVFCLVLVGAVMFGPIGAFLAAPLAAVALLWWRFGKGEGAPNAPKV